MRRGRNAAADRRNQVAMQLFIAGLGASGRVAGLGGAGAALFAFSLAQVAAHGVVVVAARRVLAGAERGDASFPATRACSG